MKRLTSRAVSSSAAITSLLSGRRSCLLFLTFVVSFGLSSCVYDSYGDEFYRTLWVSEEDPFGEVPMALAEADASDEADGDGIPGSGFGGGSIGVSGGKDIGGDITDGIAGSDSESGFGGGFGDGAADGVSGGDDDEGFGSASGDDNISGSGSGDGEGVGRSGFGGKVTIEFLCGGSISVKANGAAGSYGTYDYCGDTAHFANLRLTYMTGGTPVVIVIEEARRTGDTLLISWHCSGSDALYVTRLVRKSSYE